MYVCMCVCHVCVYVCMPPCIMYVCSVHILLGRNTRASNSAVLATLTGIAVSRKTNAAMSLLASIHHVVIAVVVTVNRLPLVVGAEVLSLLPFTTLAPTIHSM